MRHLLSRTAISLALAASAALAAPSAPAHAVFPGTNGKIVYSGSDGDFEIFSINPDGTNTTQLTNNSVADTEPTVAPNGNKIAFTRDSSSTDAEIYTMQMNGNNLARITNNASGDVQPSWSPDGTKLVYVNKAGGDAEIWVMNADGTNATQLTDNNVLDNEPAWSPDGTTIAFQRRTDLHFDIYTMRPTGANQKRIINCNDIHDCVSPDWGPNSNKITYTRWHLEPPYTAEVFIASADGSNAQMKTVAGGYYAYSAFSPDGNYLVYSGGPHDELFKLALPNGNVQAVTNTTAVEWGPDWGTA
jgi:Tol biopolymer transport system component